MFSKMSDDCCHFITTTAITFHVGSHNYIMCVLYNVCVSGHFHNHMLTHTHRNTHTLTFTQTEKEGESLSPPQELKASMSGILPVSSGSQNLHTPTCSLSLKKQKSEEDMKDLMSKNAPNTITKVQILRTVPRIYRFPSQVQTIEKNTDCSWQNVFFTSPSTGQSYFPPTRHLINCLPKAQSVFMTVFWKEVHIKYK